MDSLGHSPTKQPTPHPYSPITQSLLLSLPQHVLAAIFVHVDEPAALASTSLLLHGIAKQTSVRLNWFLARRQALLASKALVIWLKKVHTQARDTNSIASGRVNNSAGVTIDKDFVLERLSPNALQFSGIRLFDINFTAAVVKRYCKIPIQLAAGPTDLDPRYLEDYTEQCMLFACAFIVACINGYGDVIDYACSQWRTMLSCLSSNTPSLQPEFNGEQSPSGEASSHHLQKHSRNAPSLAALNHTCLLAEFFNPSILASVFQTIREPFSDPTHLDPLFISALYVSIINNHTAVFSSLLDLFRSHSPPLCWHQWTDNSFSGPLDLAAVMGRIEMVQQLLALPLDPDGHSLPGVEFHFTPLHLAVLSDEEQVVLALLAAGANIHSTVHGMTAIHLSARRGHANIMRHLIQHSTTDSLNAPSARSWAPLHFASRAGNLDCVRLLCQAGANPNIEDDGGTTPLFFSLEGTARKLEVANALIEEFNVDVQATDHEGWTAAHYAARWGYDEILTKLLVRGANVNSKDYDGWSLLHCACKSGRPEIVSLLIAHSADVNALDSEGWSCLHFACDVDSELDPAEIVALFLRVGVDINVKAAKGLTALHLACRWGHWKTTEYLLAAGSIADVKHDNGMTAMHFAAKAGSLRCFEQVLPLNDVNCVDEQGSTVAHFCVNSLSDLSYSTVLDLITALAEHNADLNIEDVKGETPLLSALRQRSFAVAVHLVKHGADVSVADADGNTILHHFARPHFHGSGTEWDWVMKRCGAELAGRRNRQYKTPLHCAFDDEDDEFAVRLARAVEGVPGAAAALSVGDAAGRTPLQYYLEAGNERVVAALRLAGASEGVADSEEGWVNSLGEVLVRDAPESCVFARRRAGAEEGVVDPEDERMMYSVGDVLDDGPSSESPGS